MKFSIGYPDIIEEYANLLINQPEILEIFNEENLDNPKDFFERTCELCMPKFLNGDEIIITEDEFILIINYTIVTKSLISLEKQNLVMNIASDDEEPKYVLTKKGETYMALYDDKLKNNDKH